ncbi:hypothetical protein LOD99_11265 [Oopsacas minuta]|uniref:Uncharacterized protein n=1 Tax=Oopsacas minuta TaxID=111878 RepID=A0AAV7K5P3_9METZ|nr:hypothetical protein LOD99_11265 [Oopsacas minuta]
MGLPCGHLSESVQHNLENKPKRKLAVSHPKEEFCVACQLRVYPTEKFIADGRIIFVFTCEVLTVFTPIPPIVFSPADYTFLVPEHTSAGEIIVPIQFQISTTYTF